MRSVEERFWEKVDRTAGEDACWPWVAALHRDGYGKFGLARGGEKPKIVIASRFAYELTHGSIDDGLCICHTCDNPSCCNPQHLFAGTRRDNTQDMIRKGRHYTQRRDTCKHGHLWTEYGYYTTERNGTRHRRCRVCMEERKRRRAEQLNVWLGRG